MHELFTFCQTDKQREIVNAILAHGSHRKAAIALGINRTNVDSVVSRLKVRQAKVANPGPVKIFVIPDVQAKPGVPLDHLRAAGNYIAEKKPDIIVCIGDFADMPSLSLYDRGKRSFEGRRYKADIEATHEAMETLMAPIVNKANYDPKLILTLGNHEHRIARATEDDSKLDGTIGLGDLGYAEWGWEVIPFLTVKEVQGINFSHYFYNPNSGRPWAGTAHTKLKNIE